MGSGYKDFAPGDSLAAADVDGYLMRQTVMTFADAAARNTALSGVLDEGMVAYLEDSNIFTIYDGSAWQDMMSMSQTWSPTWTNLTVGNGTQTAFYQRTGDVITYSLNLVFGSTSAVSGAVAITAPVTAANADELANGASCQMFDTSASNWYPGVGLTSSTTVVGLAVRHISNSYGPLVAVDASIPFSLSGGWATSDKITLSGTYRAA